MSFSWVPVLFLNSWRVSVVPYYVTILTLQLDSKTALTLKRGSNWTSTHCEWAFKIQAGVSLVELHPNALSKIRNTDIKGKAEKSLKIIWNAYILEKRDFDWGGGQSGWVGGAPWGLGGGGGPPRFIVKKCPEIQPQTLRKTFKVLFIKLNWVASTSYCLHIVTPG
jgi:hypothetical protein